MKLYKPKKEEWLSFLVLMPFITTGCNYLLFESRFLSKDVLIGSNAIMYFVGFLAWYSHVGLTHFINHRFSHYTRVTERTLWLLLLHIFVMASSMAVYFFGYDYFHFLGYRLNTEKYMWSVIVSFVITSIATSAWSFSYNIRMWRQVVRENEALQQENLEAEFERLKKKVNPHFLFNSLTSISTLIDEDPSAAELFIDEMSKVYRYLLRDSEKGLIKLEEEIAFIKAYYFLLKKRYDVSIEMSLNIGPDFMNYLIPIHTLQLLVDNAIKHNKTLRESPLTISITTTPGGNLEVVNNLQRKVVRMDTAPIGLNNIRQKYEVLTRKEILVKSDAKVFSVIIPLIEA